MHTDNAGDLTSKHIREFLLQQGIRLIAPSPHVPRQNGARERQWRTMALDMSKRISDVKAASILLVVPSRIIYRRLVSPAAARSAKRIVVVQVHRHCTLLCGRTPYRISRVPEIAASTSQVVPAIRAVHLPWTRTQSTRSHVPRHINETDLCFPARKIHRNI
eukprot:2647678-Pleurochrysis_carterae.AAC.1